MTKLTTQQQTILSFHNYMNCDCQLTEDMFLVAWVEFEKRNDDKYPCKKIFDGNCTGINKPFCYKTCKFYRNYTKLAEQIKHKSEHPLDKLSTEYIKQAADKLDKDILGKCSMCSEIIMKNIDHLHWCSHRND